IALVCRSPLGRSSYWTGRRRCGAVLTTRTCVRKFTDGGALIPQALARLEYAPAEATTCGAELRRRTSGWFPLISTSACGGVDGLRKGAGAACASGASARQRRSVRDTGGPSTVSDTDTTTEGRRRIARNAAGDRAPAAVRGVRL